MFSSQLSFCSLKENKAFVACSDVRNGVFAGVRGEGLFPEMLAYTCDGSWIPLKVSWVINV